MKRIGRYILNGLTVLSLVLCLTSCVLWVLFLHRQYIIAGPGGAPYRSFRVVQGSFYGALYVGRSGPDFRWYIDLWKLVLASAGLPAVWLVRTLWGRASRLPGHCRHCNYDLRATPHRCPECGTIPAKAKA